MTADAHSGAHFADGCCFDEVEILANDRLSRDTFRLRFQSANLAARIVPGQFVMVRLAGFDDPLLGRPLALYDTVCDAAGYATAVEVVYRVMGRMTGRLARYVTGQRVEVWGPLGNAFSAAPVEHLILVAGGIGHTPMMALAREFLGLRSYGGGRKVTESQRVTLCYGERSAEYFAGVDAFRALGVDVRLSTDDGSLGHHGRVTDLLNGVLDEHGTRGRIACCGPEPMMKAVAEIAENRGVPCQLSLETPMACGLGICFSCVAKIRQPGGGWDYRRTCVEGPIFAAADIEF